MYMFIDTIFPRVYRPTFLDFEQSIAWTSVTTPEESKDYPFMHKHNEWLAKKYRFRLNTMMLYEEKGAMSVAWSLGGGCYIHTNNMNPKTGEFDDDPRYLYLVLAYRNKDTWDGKPLFPRLKKWLNYLEEMPDCPIEAVYCRATDCTDKKQQHLQMTGMLLDVDANTSRLTKCYRRYFGATDWQYLDRDQKPYLKWRFQPDNPKK